MTKFFHIDFTSFLDTNFKMTIKTRGSTSFLWKLNLAGQEREKLIINKNIHAVVINCNNISGDTKTCVTSKDFDLPHPREEVVGKRRAFYHQI
jgi:hypothetical protein